MTDTTILSIDRISKAFVAERNVLGKPLKTVQAVDDVTLTLNRGETLALVGESGCGKSTLGRLMMRLIEPTTGTVMLDGEDITALSDDHLQAVRRKIQLIFQDPFASLNPRMTVGQMVAEPLMLHNIVPPRERTDRVIELLEAVGLGAQHFHRYPHEFSGGQRQRVVIARALAANPSVIVCDEPVSALDVSIRSQILNLLRDLQVERNLSYLFISHDLSVVRHIADRVAVMYLGRIVEIGTAEDVFSTPRHPYTRALISAIPLPEPGARGEQKPLEGDLPSAMDPPSGCHFHTRCPFAQEICSTDKPALISGSGSHPAACHFRDTLPPADDILPTPRPVDPRLEKLFAAFRTPVADGATA
ncbi:MAG TPA: dipeptide ABC transporter ATP-binding protein [Devosiaceae bacterium]|jgi:peptide/nickel transport system ATP-binding protein/oligopeptide transport system ATP-binding protein